ncbi:hypothetical protein [uncultured Paraglaciecola sp.]|uniref:hypothetical protein n=1 Tax=uncultured Paraglaciecola sp. TaxID=1765024 RepID=UPI0030D895F7|tara:strand:+ start:127212 stop:127793 length:582 start_codon:yes stop_codon:yes gene_type:complete
MSEHQDSLSQLWHNQKVEQADLCEVTKKWRKVKLKQRFYVALDFFSLSIPFAILWVKAEQLDKFTLGLIFAVMSVSVVMVFYITWLRRFSLGWSNVSTEQHIQQLQKQIQNNIKIANLSLHSVWCVVLLLMVFYGTLYYFQVYPPEKLVEKMLLSGAINAIALPCIWVWASRRKARFNKELIELNHLLDGSAS